MFSSFAMVLEGFGDDRELPNNTWINFGIADARLTFLNIETPHRSSFGEMLISPSFSSKQALLLRGCIRFVCCLPLIFVSRVRVFVFSWGGEKVGETCAKACQRGSQMTPVWYAQIHFSGLVNFILSNTPMV